MTLIISIGLLLIFANRNTDLTNQGSAIKPNQETIKFGVYASDKPSIMYTTFKPIMDYLQKEIRKKDLNRKLL